MKKRPSHSALLTTLLLPGLCGSLAWSASEPLNPVTIEKEILRVSRGLQSVPDETWKGIAGNQISETYTIAQGDTLSDISKRLFGDAKYWPKIWALNNPVITNPHVIRPGKQIVFIAGSGTDLPSVEVKDAETPAPQESDATEEQPTPPEQASAPAPTEASQAPSNDTGPEPERKTRRPAKSREWADLPRQRWEHIPIVLPEQAEQVGLGRDIKEKLRISAAKITFDLKAVISSRPLENLGEIYASNSRSRGLSVGDKVFIHAKKGKLQLGQTYAITEEPVKILAARSSTEGYSHHLLGKVVVQDFIDGVYIGGIVFGSDLMTRGTFLIHQPAPIPLLNPIPGPRAMDAAVLVDRTYSTFTLAQHKQVYLDRGTADGVKPGMVFQIFSHEDPYNNVKFSSGKVHAEADIQVIQVSEHFSTGVITRSNEPILENAIASLVTEGKTAGANSPSTAQ
jgi:LysM repeat protein